MSYLWYNPMKIVLLITGLGRGGAERQVCDLADQFATLHHEVIIVYLTGEAAILPTNPSIRVIGMGMNKTVWSFLVTYIRIRTLIQSFHPDVLHTHMVHANIIGRLLRLFTTIPRLICTAHSTNEGGKLRMLVYRVTDSLCDLSTNVSQEAVNSFIEKKAVPPKRMIAMVNGIDTKKFVFDPIAREQLRSEENISDSTHLLLCVGRLMKEKDYPNMLQAFQSIYQKNNDTCLWIVGIGEELSVLLKMAEELGIQHKVKFLGLRHDIPELMSACDIFCLSSLYEGFGLVVAEAMSCERIVVATDCGGVKEVIGKCGILVPPNSPEGLAQGIEQALQFSSLEKRTLGNSARRRIVENYSIETIAQRWLSLYSSEKSTNMGIR
jgi:glycosyltransferase involved in cell wall biosynthesis